MQFCFEYRIWYTQEEIQNGPVQPCIEITEDEYKQILLGVKSGKEITEIPGIEPILQKMRERVLLIDQQLNKDGTKRKAPLKKPRKPYLIEYFLCENDLNTLMKMKEPKTELNRSQESLTIFKHDGTPVKLTYQYGSVTITEGTRSITWDADTFLKRIKG